ncbi:formiminoglutamase [Halogranum gelatinilyticum]|uniref:Formimidoylglutamase n=1 Tax=Halogranum gelatinilyticum TaxID=660521 RepID=A0A1G9PCC5_9EURY|nr:formimidoylglutamase [Halogranum gelatinilyticum]SDL96409.1 formiminoglutamase [Halogranum gelatinilyticum]
MSEFSHSFTWQGTSSDPNDEQFGHVVEATSIDEARAFDVVLVGEPFDRGVIGRPGAEKGPAALRAALTRSKTHHYGTGPVGGVDGLGVGDLGDVDGLGGTREHSAGTPVADRQARLRETTELVHGLDALPVFLGGDNSLTFPNVAPLLSRGRVGVVNLDAHLDVREVRTDATSGTPYRQLLEAGLDGYACLGARHFETSTIYADYVREMGGDIVTAEAVGDDPLAAADRALDALGDVDYVYVSVDLDVLDAAAAPGVSAPTPGGLTTRELFWLLRRLAGDPRASGFEVVECAPPLDRNGLTASAGGRAVAHFLAGYAGNGGHDE